MKIQQPCLRLDPNDLCLVVIVNFRCPHMLSSPCIGHKDDNRCTEPFWLCKVSRRPQL